MFDFIEQEDERKMRERLQASVASFFVSPNADFSSSEAFYNSYIRQMSLKNKDYRVNTARENKELFLDIAEKLYNKKHNIIKL